MISNFFSFKKILCSAVLVLLSCKHGAQDNDSSAKALSGGKDNLNEPSGFPKFSIGRLETVLSVLIQKGVEISTCGKIGAGSPGLMTMGMLKDSKNNILGVKLFVQRERKNVGAYLIEVYKNGPYFVVEWKRPKYTGNGYDQMRKDTFLNTATPSHLKFYSNKNDADPQFLKQVLDRTLTILKDPTCSVQAIPIKNDIISMVNLLQGVYSVDIKYDRTLKGVPQ